MSQVNLFRIQAGREKAFLSFIESKYQTVASSSTHGFDYKFVYQQAEGDQEVNWGWAFSLFDQPIKKMATMPKGILLIKQSVDDSRQYAASFGGAHFHLDQYADRNFGFEIACRVSVKKTRMTATTNTNSKRNKTISSFKEFNKLEINSGESYTKLKILIERNSASEIIDEGIEVGTSLKVNLREVSFENIAKLIEYVEQVLRGPQKTRIPFFKLVTKLEDIDGLELKLKADFLKDESTITISEFDVVGTDEVFNRADSYTLRCGKESLDVTSLDWPTVRLFFEEKHIDNIEDMFSTNVKFLVNGNSKVAKPIRGLIDYLNESEHALLIGGKWYRFNDDYVTCLHESLADLPVVYDSQYDLTRRQYDAFIEQKCRECRNEAAYSGLPDSEYQKKIKCKFYREYAFNLMRQQEGYELWDRHLVVLRSGDKIEVCDLRKDGAIYSVKRGTGSSELSYLVDQSESVIDYYSNRELPRSERPGKVVLWMILSRADRLPISDSVLEWDKLGMLLFKINVDTWMKKAWAAGMKPEIRLNYEID